jgi:flagella basal body P-ring formation protein FlgA
MYRVREQAELEVKLQVMAQTSQRAESSLELAQAEQHNAERLMEGSVKMLRERCAGLEKELRRVQTENSRWEQRVAVAERKVREGELLHARDSTLYTHQVGDLEAKIRHLSSTVSAVADPRCCAGLL